MSLSYRDATAEADSRVHYPELVYALEELGFARVGRLEAEVAASTWQSTLREYAQVDAARLVEARSVQPVVLTAPDRSAFVDVDWFWGQPSVRLRSELSDGRVVETALAWHRPPAWPVRLQRARRHRDLRQEQLTELADGRDVGVVSTDDPAELWEGHRARVLRSGTAPVEHTGMDQVVRLYDRLYRHGEACAQRARTVTSALLVVFSILPLLLVLALLANAPIVWATVAVGVWIAVATQADVLPVRLRYVRWLRPALTRHSSSAD